MWRFDIPFGTTYCHAAESSQNKNALDAVASTFADFGQFLINRFSVFHEHASQRFWISRQHTLPLLGNTRQPFYTLRPHSSIRDIFAWIEIDVGWSAWTINKEQMSPPQEAKVDLIATQEETEKNCHTVSVKYCNRKSFRAVSADERNLSSRSQRKFIVRSSIHWLPSFPENVDLGSFN